MPIEFPLRRASLLVQECPPEDLIASSECKFAWTQSFKTSYQDDFLLTRRKATHDLTHFMRRFPIGVYLQWELSPKNGRLHFHALLVSSCETMAQIKSAFLKRYGNIDLRPCHDTTGWLDYVKKVDTESSKSQYQIWKPLRLISSRKACPPGGSPLS